MAILHTSNDECVHALKIRLIQLGEPAGIPLRGFDQQTFLLHRLYKLTGGRKSHGGKTQPARRLHTVSSQDLNFVFKHTNRWPDYTADLFSDRMRSPVQAGIEE